MPIIKSVAFDVFGTLLHITDPRGPFPALLAKLGQPPERAAKNKRFIMSNNLGLAGVANALGGKLSLAQLAELETDLYTELRSIRLFPETLAVLDALRSKGLKIGIASNLAAPYAGPAQALLPSFDVTAWSFEVGAVKPEAAMYDFVIRSFGCRPDEILMVGDSLTSDVTGAQAFGLQARRINRSADRAEGEIGSLSDVLSLIE